MEDEGKGRKLELLIGLVLAVFAAALAVCDLGGGKYGDEEMIAIQKQTEAYNWYQSKSIKQSLVEGQRDFLGALLKAHSITESQRASVESFITELSQQIGRYKKEKEEILKGSAVVGKEHWIQDKNGVLGQIKGAQEWQAEAERLGGAGDIFDRATLFLQMCLVFGAVSLVLQTPRTRVVFFMTMVVLGSVGVFYTWAAYTAAIVV